MVGSFIPSGRRRSQGHPGPPTGGTCDLHNWIAPLGALLPLSLALVACTNNPSAPNSEGTLPDVDGTRSGRVHVPASIEVRPEGVEIAADSTTTFRATVRNFKGAESPDQLSWQSTGGAITSNGTYTAGSTLGSFRVVVTTSNGLADTAFVLIVEGRPASEETSPDPSTESPPDQTSSETESKPEPEPATIVVGPTTAELLTDAVQVYRAEVRDAHGSLLDDFVTWEATGGTIDATGRYTAGPKAGSYSVIGRASNSIADTATVTIEEPATADSNPVHAGSDQTFPVSESVPLNGSVSDASLIHHFWEKVSGPGTVTFGHEEFFSGWETADFSEWRRHEERGDYVTTAKHRSGRYSWAAHADPTLPEPDNHSAKVLYWGTTDHSRLYIIAWFFFPGDYLLQKKAGGTLNLLQFKQRDGTPTHYPTWILVGRKAQTVSGDAELAMMDWQKATGTAFYYAEQPLPKDRWVQVTVYLKKHHTDGVLIVWIDGLQKWMFRNVNTLGSTGNTDLMWGLGNYGKDIAEDEAVYWDDARAWRADQNDVLSTTARFSEPGTYVLRLSASGGGRTRNDEVAITVH